MGDRVGAAAPAVFSPNGDGRYDTFFPGIASSSSANWQLVVVDEQGRKVFESNSVLKHRKGQQMWYSDTVKIER